MNEKQLSARLLCVANFIPKDSVIADIGSDHAYLPCYLYLQGKIKSAIAGEVNEGPYQLAKKQVKRLGLTTKIDVRKGDGLSVLAAKEVDVVIIAGMGGGLITSILEAGKDKLNGVMKLILQPNVGAEAIRVWLRENGWRLEEEAILEEDDKIYEIISAQRGGDEDLYKEERDRKLLLGPYLMKEKNAAFCKKWAKELNNWRNILLQMNEADGNEQLAQKRKQLAEKIRMVEEVLK